MKHPRGSWAAICIRIDNVYPDGIAYCQLTDEEIAIVRSSEFVRPIATVPAPGAILLATVGIGFARFSRKRIAV